MGLRLSVDYPVAVAYEETLMSLVSEGTRSQAAVEEGSEPADHESHAFALTAVRWWRSFVDSAHTELERRAAGIG
jgi:hypothetical protein